MKVKYSLLLSLLPFFSIGQFADKKTYNIKRITEKPTIDGKIDDNTWLNLDIANNFIQLEPNNGKKERKNLKTEVKICYDNKNIYFGIIMYDNSPTNNHLK